MSTRYLARGHETFDVYDGPRFVGSVWRYRFGWASFDADYNVMSGFFPSREVAAAALVGEPK